MVTRESMLAAVLIHEVLGRRKRTNNISGIFTSMKSLKNLRKRRIRYFEIKRIVIGDAIGQFRRCPHSRGSWPDPYLFCPNDGTATVWGKPAAPIVQNVQVTPEERAKRHAKFLEATVNANLSRAGYDPASERAQKVRDFSLLWMNPLADPKEIHGKLDELRKTILSDK